MPGYVYYIAVSSTGLALAVYVIYKKKSYAKLITFYMFAAVVADCGEVLVLILLNAYSYKLGIFADAVANDILGHILPNSTLWPAVAVFIAAYSPRVRWMITAAFSFIMLDILFSGLGVYQHNWWQSWMSGVAVFVYCILMRFWYSKFEEAKFKFLRFISFSCAFMFITFLPIAALLLTGYQFDNTGIFADRYRDSIFFSFILYGTLALFCTLFLCVLKRWYWKLAPFIIFFASDLLLAALGAKNFYNGWNVFYLMIVQAVCILLFIRLEKKYNYDIDKQG